MAFAAASLPPLTAGGRTAHITPTLGTMADLNGIQ